jgi:hypothetical protein
LLESLHHLPTLDHGSIKVQFSCSRAGQGISRQLTLSVVAGQWLRVSSMFLSAVKRA